MNQPILLYRSGSVYANETAAWAALDAVTHKKGQPIVAFYTLSSPVSGHHGSSTIGAIFAIGIGDGVGQYKACTSHDDMLIVAQSLNAHITQFNQMFEYDANHNAIKAKLDFYTTDGKSISAGGIGSGSSASLGALYQLVDVMANSSNTGVEGAVEGSVLAYDATAGKWKAIAQSEILPDMSGYYTKDETDSAINTAKSNLQGQVDTLKAIIPATASADNQLADKDFVNSSIATATAEFRGSFTSLDELKATSGNLNDYAFYLHTDDVGNKVVDRYKWTTAGWLYEYTLNNSSFTAEQWAALNSAITATLVQSYNSHLDNSTIHITAAERTAWNAKWDYNEEIIKAVKVNAAVNADKLATARTLWGQSFDGSGNVSGDISLIWSKLYWGNSAGNYSIGFDDDDKFKYNCYFGHSFYSNSTQRLSILLNGNVLIGTTADNGYKLDVNGKGHYSGDLVCGGEVVAVAGEGTPAGVTDYSALTGKPSINGVTLVSGDNTLAALGIQAAGDYVTNSEVTTLLANYADKTFVSNNYVGKAAFNSHTADTDIHITSAERTAWNAKWDYNEATIKAVKVTSASSADSVAWSGISGKPTSLKNPYALTFGSKSYDGSAAVTITASDLGALTAHQSIYALTLQVNSVSQGTYNPASAAKTINIAVPTKTSDITNDSGFITSASIPTALKNPYAVEIKANGVSLGTYDGSAAATFNLSAANVGAANKVHTHTASEISGLPTNLSSFTNDVGYITGITKSMVEGVLTGDITSHQHEKITHTLWEYYNAISDTTSPRDICANFNVGISDVHAIFPGIVQNSTGKRYQSLFWTGYGAAGLVELSKSYGSDGRLKYRVSEGWSDNGAHWSAAGYRELANIEDLTWANIESKPTTIAGYGITDALTTSNYNSYAPTLTGTGASGTWGISITGNAATATNADTLDGYHETGFYRAVKREIPSGDLASLEAGSYYASSTAGDTNPLPSTYVSLSVLGKSYYSQQLCATHNATRAWLRGIINSTTTTVSDWHELAFTDSNVASATKLQTPRTIWGKPFDGTGNIRGDLNMQYNKITFGESANDYHIGWGNGDMLVYKNYFGHYFVTNNTERMRITIGGNVLIGTTTDNGSKMMIHSSVSKSERPSLGNLKGDIVSIGYSGYYGVHLWNEGSGNGFVQVGRSDGNATAYHLILQPLGGYVGINTDSPKYKLDVNGTGHYSGDLIVDGEVSALVA